MSTRCSTARGPARSPSLVTWPTRRSGAPVDLAMRVRRSTQHAHLGQAAGGLAQFGVGDRLERVDHHQGRAVTLDGGLDRLDVGPLERQEMPRHEADARGPSPHLGQRLLGRGQHDVDAGGRQRREHLEEQRRLADAGGTEQQRDRAGHHAAAHDPVELADPGRQRVDGVGRDVGQRRRGRAAGRCRFGAGFARAGAGPSVFHSPQAGQRPVQRKEVAVAGRAQRSAVARVGTERARGAVAMAAPYGRGVTTRRTCEGVSAGGISKTLNRSANSF